MNNVGYIYKITNNINGKSYIGQTKHFYEYRWNEHKCRYLNKNSKAYNNKSWGYSSVGRASALQVESQGFKSL